MKKRNDKVKTKINGNVNSNDEVTKLVKITAIIVFVYAAFFVITKIGIEKNKNDQNNEKEEVAIQFEEILLGKLLEQSESEYYVLITFKDDIYSPLYNSYFVEYHKKDDALPKYSANINNIFNQKYISEESNFDAKELKFKESTLLKIKYKQIVEIYQGRKSIMEHLKKIID